MKDIYLQCDQPCWSCPVYNRSRKITNFADRKLDGAFYCPHCDTYALCKMGIAHRRNHRKELIAVCTKCSTEMKKISVSYETGQNDKPFSEQSIIVVRIPNDNKYKIVRSLKSHYFDDVADILYYILSEIGSGYYNLIDYNPVTNSYRSIFTGFLQPNKVCLKNVPEEKLLGTMTIGE